jgi:type IV pilus assembly protein PilE
MNRLLPARRGFTLIEVMIVLVVLGLLALIAYPSFVSFLIRTDRADAREALAAVQLAQERYRPNNSPTYVYADDVADLGLSSVSPKGFYEIAILVDADIPTPTRDTFTVTATAISGTRQARDTAACQELVLTVSPTGATRTLPECW